MTCKRIAFFLACGLMLTFCTACRCTVAVSLGGDADATMEAGKLYDDVSIDPTVKIPLLP